MAEIKSTLDLIMEKTKNLTMTEDEKKALQKKEWEGKVRALLQKYRDGSMNLEEIKGAIESSQATFPNLRTIFKEEILKHIQPEDDNEVLLELLRELTEIDVRYVERLIEAFRNRLTEHAVLRRETLKKTLEQKKIYGSSIVPNLDHDREWQDFREKQRRDFNNQLSLLKDTETSRI